MKRNTKSQNRGKIIDDTSARAVDFVVYPTGKGTPVDLPACPETNRIPVLCGLKYKNSVRSESKKENQEFY